MAFSRSPFSVFKVVVLCVCAWERLYVFVVLGGQEKALDPLKRSPEGYGLQAQCWELNLCPLQALTHCFSPRSVSKSLHPLWRMSHSGLLWEILRYMFYLCVHECVGHTCARACVWRPEHLSSLLPTSESQGLNSVIGPGGECLCWAILPAPLCFQGMLSIHWDALTRTCPVMKCTGLWK